MKIQLKSDEDLTIVTKGGGKVIVPNNTDTSTNKTLATVDQIGPVGGDKANAASIAAPYESDHSSAYVVGNYVTHEGTLYKCKSDTSSPPGEWDDNNWDPVAVTDEKVSKSGDTMTGGLTVPHLTVGERESETVGENSVAEGLHTTASSFASHAEGFFTTASGDTSHAEGAYTTASNTSSHAEGEFTIAQNYAEHAQGQYNASHTGATTAEKTVHSIGVGSDENHRANAVEVMRDGKVFVKGVGGYDGTNPTTATDLATIVMGGGVGDRIVSQNERTEVVANQDGTASIIDNEGQKGLNIPEGFSFSGISFEESGLVAFSGPYKLNGAPSNAWFWLPPGVDPSTWEYGTTSPSHVFLGGTSESEPVAVLDNGLIPLYAISGWNTDNPTLTRSQSAPYLPEDITVAMVPLEKTVATVDQIPTDIVSHQELDDALFNKVSQNAQFRMSIKDDGKVVVSGCRYRSANSTTQPFSNTYCVVSSETSLFDGGGGKIDFKIFNSTNGELLYRAVGYATGNWTVLQNNLTSEAASYLPDVGGDIQFVITATTNPENKVLGVYLTSSSVILQPWSNFTSWADSKTKTLATLQNIAADFSMGSTYAVGDYVTYDGSLWKCKVAVTTAGQWTGSDNWEEFIVTDEMGGGGGGEPNVIEIVKVNGVALTPDANKAVDVSVPDAVPLPFDAEVEYITIPPGAYVDSGVVDYGNISTFDLDLETWFGSGFFRFGCWRGGQDTSYMIWDYGEKLGTCKHWIVNTNGFPARPTGSAPFRIRTNGKNYFVDNTGATISSYSSVRQNAARFLIGALDNQDSGTIDIGSIPINIYYMKFMTDVVFQHLIPVRIGSVGYLYDKISGKIFGSETSVSLIAGPNKATPTITTPPRIIELTNSPAFTGTPTAPDYGSSPVATSQIATVGYVNSKIGDIDSILDTINGEEI